MICLKTLHLQTEEKGTTYNASAVNGCLYLLLHWESNYMFMNNLSFFKILFIPQEASISVLLPAAHDNIIIQLKLNYFKVIFLSAWTDFVVHSLLNDYQFEALLECWNKDVIESGKSEQESALGIINMKANMVFFKLPLSKRMGSLYFLNNLGYPGLHA